MADIRSKALGYYRDGKLRILRANWSGEGLSATELMAHVDGHRSTYMVRFHAGEWHCTCRTEDCAHIAAVQLATGHPSTAAKQERKAA